MDCRTCSLVAVDPGLRGCGVAVFRNAVLERALYVPSSVRADRGAVAWVAMSRAVACALAGVTWQVGAVERPKQYDGPVSKARRDDISELSAVAGAVALVLGSMGAEVHSPYPVQWKGQLPKDVGIRRIQAKLTPSEVERIERAGALTHNVLDAVGIGLWMVHRFRGGAKPFGG